MGSECSEWRHWMKKYRQCLVDILESSPKRRVWSELNARVNTCQRQLPVKFALKPFTNRDETKLAIVPVNRSVRDENCTLVTLGIGGDIRAESRLKSVYPNCRFFGADPLRLYNDVYDKIGKYFETAVGSSNGFVDAQVKFGPRMSDYAKRTVSQVDLTSFLRRSVDVSTIDHLWIDNEGAEYGLMSYFHRNGSLANNGITVCQLNVEFHGPIQNYNSSNEEFAAIILNLLTRLEAPLFQFHFFAERLRKEAKKEG
uniref:Methyltransferase FkbM domain-containing protein n=1 Tax=Plectus sambesii TaxID=2011161 RepID=A0A914WV19_9BILA